MAVIDLQPAIDKAIETATNIRSILGAMLDDEKVDSTQAIYQALEAFGFIAGYLGATRERLKEEVG